MPAANLWWHQFWTWWLYNPKEYLGFGMHEGDWEMVQIGCDDQQGDNPVLMTCSQHKSGQKHEYWSGVQLEAGRPKVYVAVGSHANYYSVHHDEVDDADGHGIRVDPQVDEFGAWATWNGQWGNSDNSPGPLPSHLSWRAPHPVPQPGSLKRACSGTLTTSSWPASTGDGSRTCASCKHSRRIPTAA